MVELSLLPDPENSERQKAHHVNAQPRRQIPQREPEAVFRVNRFDGRRAQVQHQQRHGDGKYAVAQSSKSRHALPGDLVVGRRHTQ